ncbi:autotransporter outer membrane beta-barrel domain-containing protein [Bradyrhizobium tropiciagri]|uniref:autotransporter outer membrane beta-barrel domain-containing protein n=1 Tax=Bradyrhizobium tropiciagri TaxID=312253 RepID=UPI001BA5661E|nr:autotransporter outer membrane beta-barrel domain-containing protein [Bradyrhizobium tropiciagri]MBR0895930.1 autotransporter outer membrane beta-barrel domain-containing protein [Bradyrhizobium tropiciagri]
MRECIGAATKPRHVGDNPLDPHRTASTARTRAHFQRLLLLNVSVAALSALMPGSAAAQSWTGATSNDWTVGSNWSGGTAPVAGGAANIVPGSNVVLGVNPGATGTAASLNVRDLAGGATNLTIQNGSTLTMTGTAAIGDVAGGTATVTVTGAGTRWNAGTISLFAGATSVLNITDGATVSVTSRIIVGSPAGAGSATLNVSNATVENHGAGISVGNAHGRVNFDNAIFRALINTTAVSTGTAAQNNIAAGGLTIDNNGFLILQANGFSGVGGLTKTGAGIFRFGGAGSSYTGETVIQQGTLQLSALAGSGNGVASSSRVVDNAIFDLSFMSDPNAHIQSLAGSSAGSVTLGTKDLIITNANDTFAGTISGTGGLQLTGGTQALSGVQTYSGATTITAGTLALTGAGDISASSQVIANGTFSIAGLTSAGTSIQRLSGTGSVDLGARTLTLTAANDTFAGVIGGSGGLTLAGGTEALSGANTYGGVTTISAGTLALTGTGSISNSSHVVANSVFDISGLTSAGTSIQSLAGTGSVALGGKTLTITNGSDNFAGKIGGTGGLAVSGGTQTLSGVNTYSGATTVTSGTLQAGAANAFSAASAATVGTGGTFDLNGFNQTMGALSNAGTIRFGATPGTTLTVAGNYAGNGGTLLFNTVLGGDGSATDRLIAGSTSGTSTVRIANAGGGGAQTVNGIKLIDVTGASNGTFALAGNYSLQGQQAIVAGAYAYTLQKNGVSTPTDGDWYLRSTLVPSSDPTAPTPAGVPAGPLYQPGVPLYENYAQVLLGMNALPSMQERVGNRYWGGNGNPSEAMARMGVTPAATSDSSWTQSAFWGRVEGGQTSLRPSNTTGSTTNSDDFKAQAGLDGLALENNYGRLIVSLTLQYGLTTAYVNSFFGNGRIRAEGTGVGATATWYGDNGIYIDGQMQTMFYRGDLTSDLVGSMAHGNEGLGYAFSVEGGKRYTIGNGFTLTPQAQLAYSKVDFDGFADRFGALVSLTNADSLLGRVGLSLNHQKSWGDGGRSDLYAIGNLHYEFLDGTNVAVAGTSFASANDRLWGSIGGGGSYSWAGGRYTLFGEATYRASLQDASANYSYKGSAGFRVVW